MYGKKINFYINQFFIWVIIVIASIWSLFPFLWAIITSFKKPIDAFRLAVIPFLQFTPTLDNWRMEYINRGSEILHGVANSLIISIGSMLIALLLGTLAGYGLARFHYRRWSNSNMTMWFLSQRFLPPVAVAIPFFLIFKNLHLLDTQIALILLNATFTMPYAVLIMRSMFKELPEELEEAAMVDGASRLQVFYRIALPLAAPGLVAAGIICFSFAWNEFLFALIMTYKNAIPITIIIAGTEHTQGVQFWYVSTRLIMAVLPPAILSLTIQRYIVRGLTFGALKG
jgi:multiple sugar transport system permease protein